MQENIEKTISLADESLYKAKKEDATAWNAPTKDPTIIMILIYIAFSISKSKMILRRLGGGVEAYYTRVTSGYTLRKPTTTPTKIAL